MTDLPNRDRLKVQMQVEIETKADQGTGRTVSGAIRDVLTNSNSHSHGIMVRLQDGRIGRVKRILESAHSHDHKFEDLDEKEIPRVEDKHNEFKEFYQYDEKIERLPESMDPGMRNAKIKEIKHAVQERFAEEICAFGNDEGGFVYLGVRDNGDIVGLEKDKQFGRFANYDDAFANHIIDRLSDLLRDKAFITGNLRIKFRNMGGKTICIVQVLKSSHQIYLHATKGILFCVRGPSPRVERLDGEERDRYIKNRFPD